VTARLRPRAEDGSAALELVVLAPVLLAMLALIIAAGRTSIAQGAVDAAARDAARQASIALSPSAAQAAARSSALAALHRDGLACDPVISMDTSGFATPPGQPAPPVSVTVSCAVPLADLSLPGLPGTITMSSDFTSPLDQYRAR
jgi:Flp pilus assembly protein TadG